MAVGRRVRSPKIRTECRPPKKPVKVVAKNARRRRRQETPAEFEPPVEVTYVPGSLTAAVAALSLGDMILNGSVSENAVLPRQVQAVEPAATEQKQNTSK